MDSIYLLSMALRQGRVLPSINQYIISNFSKTAIISITHSLAAIAALYLAMSFGWSVGMSVCCNKFQKMKNTLRVHVLIIE